jgi:HK97 family phage prohead protease
MKTPETKNIEFKFKLSDDENDAGAFTGYASIFGVVDSYGDVVAKGAFKKTLKEKKQFPILWSHDITKPLGVISGVEDDRGLSVEGKLNLDVQLAREVRSLMVQGAVDGLSIGYQTVKEGEDKATKARVLQEINLWEVSAVVFQACPGAVVDEVKADEVQVAPVKEPGHEPTPEIGPTEDKGKPEFDLHLLDGLRIKFTS